ncbi:hypothetical protein IFR05_000851 [Cadophora sp. M221]|nr:hypothetical protein IFR05_000851 [Cadophora sp. M221]
MSCQSSAEQTADHAEEIAVSPAGSPIPPSPFWRAEREAGFVHHYLHIFTPIPTPIPSLASSVHSSDSIESSVPTEDGAAALSLSNRYTTAPNIVFDRFIDSKDDLRWLHGDLKGSIGQRYSEVALEVEDAMSKLPGDFYTGPQAKIPLFDPALQELAGMMDYHVSPARVPGELHPWHLKSGRDTTQPPRPSGGPGCQKRPRPQSSKSTTSSPRSSSKLLRPSRKSAVLSGVSPARVDESQENLRTSPQDGGIGTHAAPIMHTLTSLQHTLSPPLLNSTPECEKMPNQLSPEKVPALLFPAFDTILSGLVAPQNSGTELPTSSANTENDAWGVPSLSYGNTSEDSLLSQIPDFVPDPEGMWLDPDMYSGLGQDHDGEASESQANMMRSTQPGVYMGRDQEHAGPSDVDEFDEFDEFLWGFLLGEGC